MKNVKERVQQIIDIRINESVGRLYESYNKSKGSVINNPNENAIGNTRFVHCVATGGTQTGVVKNADGDTLGQFYLQHW